MDQKTKDEKKKERIEILLNILLWVGAVAFCVAIWWYGGQYMRDYAIAHAPKEEPYAIEGVFGDSFGAINALISALAFAGMIVTFWLQRKELDMQRQELKAQREEFTQQNKTLKLQRFENTFFHMMELQQQIVNDLNIRLSDKEKVTQHSIEGYTDVETIVDNSVKGRQVVQYIYRHLEHGFWRGVFDEIIESGQEGYVNAPYRDLLDHYFRHLYTILRYVDETDAFDLNDDGKPDAENEWRQKYHYTTILRSTLSRHEMLMLYYNGLSIFGREKLKPLIEKYALLNNLDKYSLSLSKEYWSMLNIDPRTNNSWYKSDGLTGRDYEFYLTEDEKDQGKYNIRAFGCKEEELKEARLAIQKYRGMLKSRGIAVDGEANKHLK